MLTGWQCVVMRPQDQGHALCRHIEKEGGEAIRLPMIDIISLPHIHTPDFERADYLIIVSANAVRCAPSAWWTAVNKSNMRIVTMGHATTEAVKTVTKRTSRFLGAIFTAPRGSTSETLLAQPFLGTPTISGKQVILLVGQTGRSLIADTLRERGAQVERVEVYAQHCPQLELDPYFVSWQVTQRAIVFIATSAHCLENIFRLTPRVHQDWLCRQPMVVISERMEKQARDKGVQHLWCSEGAHEEAIMTALKNVTLKSLAF